MDELIALDPMRQAVVLVPLAILLLISAFTDFRDRKIYNNVTYPAFFVGLAVHGIAMGWGGLGEGFLAALLVLIIGLVLLPFGWIGGGDIKLLVVVAAFLGMQGIGEVTFYSVLAGGVGGLLVALVNGYLWEMLKRMGRYLRGWYRMLLYRTTAVKEEMERDERSKIPFALAILAGGALTYSDAAWKWPQLWEIFVRSFQV